MDEKDKMGFIKVYRSIIDWEWYTDVPVRVLFEHCLLKANYQDKKWRGINIERGSFITSLENLSYETGLTVKQVRTALKKLNSTQELASKGQSSYTVITVNNYDSFQINNTPEGKQRATEGQAEGKQRATTNELKNIRNKEINNIIIGPEEKIDVEEQQQTKNFKKPTIEEIKKYCSERKNNIDAEYFFNYYESKGWQIGKNTMKDWKAAVRTWERKNFNKDGEQNAGNTADVRKNPTESKYSRANGWF